MSQPATLSLDSVSVEFGRGQLAAETLGLLRESVRELGQTLVIVTHNRRP